MGLFSASGVGVGVRASTFEEGLAFFLECVLNPGGRGRIEHSHHLARFTIHEAKGRSRAFDAVEEFALNGRRTRRHAGVKGVQAVSLAPEKVAKKRHLVVLNGAAQLRVGQAVNLDHDETGGRACSLRLWEAKQTDQPLTAAEPAACLS